MGIGGAGRGDFLLPKPNRVRWEEGRAKEEEVGVLSLVEYLSVVDDMGYAVANELSIQRELER